MPTIFSTFPEENVSNVLSTTEESRSVRFSLMQFFTAIAPFILNSASCAFHFFFDGSVLRCEMYSSDASEGFILDSRYYGFTYSSDEVVGLNGQSNPSSLSVHEINLPKIIDFKVKTRIFASFNITKKSSTSWPLCILVYNFFAPFLFSLQLEDSIAIKIVVDTFAFGGDLIKWDLPLRIFDVPKDYQMDLFDSLLINSDGSFHSLASSSDFQKKVHVLCLNGASLESEFDVVSFSKIKLPRKIEKPKELASDLDAVMSSFGFEPPASIEPALELPNIVSDILAPKPIAKPVAKPVARLKKSIKKRSAEVLDIASDYISFSAALVEDSMVEPKAVADPWAIFSEDKIFEAVQSVAEPEQSSGPSCQPTLIYNTFIEMKSNGSLDSIEVSELLAFPDIPLPGSSEFLTGPYNKSAVLDYIQKNGKNNLFKTQIAGGRGGNQKDITQKISVVMRDLVIFGKFGLSPIEVWKALEYHDKTHKKGILFALNENKIKYSMSDLLAYVSSASEPVIVFGQKKRRVPKQESFSSLLEPIASSLAIGLDMGPQDDIDPLQVSDGALEEQKASIKEIFGDEFMDFGQAFGHEDF